MTGKLGHARVGAWHGAWHGAWCGGGGNVGDVWWGWEKFLVYTTWIGDVGLGHCWRSGW